MKQILPLMVALFCSASAFAQSSPATPADERTKLIDRLKEPDQAGGLHLTEHFAVVFGGIKQGSGIALGPAVSAKFADGSFVQLKGVYSVKKFKLLQLRYDTRKFWDGRGIAISRLRWQDAPKLSVYELGPDSVNARVEFGEKKKEGSSQVVLKLTPAVRVAGGFGIESYSTSGAGLEPKEGAGGLPEVPFLPGLDTHPWYAHTFGSIGYDTRLSPDYSRDGQFFEAVVRDYHDVHDNTGSFRRFEGTAQQLIPTFAQKGVIDLSFRTWLSFSGNELEVPFFLMPALGGGDVLKAFPSYRFRDRNALLLKGEYRWAVHRMADVAGIYEAGKVAPDIDTLDFRDMAHSVALGVRVHSDKAALFRADLAHGREGWGFRIGFSAAGS